MLINMRWPIVLVSVFVIIMMAFVLQWSNNYAAQINVGNYDTVLLQGFYDVEASPNPHRWSGVQTTVRFPTINGGWNIGTIDLQNSQDSIRNQLNVVLTTITHQRIAFNVNSTNMRNYSILLPPAQQLQWYTSVMLMSQTSKTKNDARVLGIVLTKIITTPTILHTDLSYAMIIWWIIAILCAMLAWLLGASWPRIIVACIVVLTAVMLISNSHVVETMPYWHWFAAWLAICICGILIARVMGVITVTRQQQWVVPGIALPVFCAIAWWLLPVNPDC